MKSKGFTLIELLAVIVILAIIALIAVPIVLSIIDNAKKDSKVRSAENYLDATNQALATYQMKNPQTVLSGTYQVMENGNLCQGTVEGNDCTGENHIEIPVKIDGEKIMPRTIEFDSKVTIDSVTGLEINGENYGYSDGKLAPTLGSSNDNQGNGSSNNQVFKPDFFTWELRGLIGNSEPENKSTTQPDGRDIYLGYNVSNDKISEAFICFVKDGTEYCLKGYDKTAYEDNLEVIRDAFSEVVDDPKICYFIENSIEGHYECKLNYNIQVSAAPDGYVDAIVHGSGQNCFADKLGNFQCNK